MRKLFSSSLPFGVDVFGATLAIRRGAVVSSRLDGERVIVRVECAWADAEGTTEQMDVAWVKSGGAYVLATPEDTPEPLRR